jgi:asparagine synthase (glutamine-hydrolysing)
MTGFIGIFIWDFDRFPKTWKTNFPRVQPENYLRLVSEQDAFFMQWGNTGNTSNVYMKQMETGYVVIIGAARFRPDRHSRIKVAEFVAQSLANGQSIEEVLEDLDGEFVLVVWDAKTHTTCLAVDPMGHCSLYYTAGPGGAIWSDHPKSIAGLTGIRELNLEAVNLYLSLKGIPAPWSILSNVHKLKPGHVLVWNQQMCTETDYWKLEEKISLPFPDDLETARNEILNRLTSTIKSYIEDEPMPVGVFLSGGLDSTIILALVRQLKFDIKAFSVGYEPTTRGDERQYARLAAQDLGVSITEIACSSQIMSDLVLDILQDLPEPVADATLIPQLYLARKTADEVEVILDGTGADGLLGGSTKYIAERYCHLYQRIPNLLRRGLIAPISNLLPASRRWTLTDMVRKWQFFIAGCELAHEEREIYWTSFIPHSSLQHLLSPLWYLEENIGSDLLINYLQESGKNDVSGASYMTLKGIMPWVELSKLSIIERLTGVSVRKPFLSPYLIEFGLRIPEEHKLQNNQGKFILRQASIGLIPEAIIDRPKANFSPPVSDWLSGDLRDIFWETISRQTGIFNIEFVRRMFRQNSFYWRDWRSELWALFMLQGWWIKNMTAG